jgi:N-acetylneuraminate lyase
MMSHKKIKGLIAAVFTPYNADGSVNPAIVGEYAARMKQLGVAGVFVNGSSGEGMLLSVSERKEMAEEWAAHGTENFKVIIHVGSSSVEIARDLAAHAQSVGAFAIASMAPNFFPSSDVNVIADYCRQVAAEAPLLPFYYYHLPVATGSHIKVHELLTVAAATVPNLVGVKFTYTDFMDMHLCMSLEGGRYDVLHGHDEILLNGLVLGVTGAIGTTFNFIPGVYQNIIDAFEAGDLAAARKWQMVSINVVRIMLKYVNAIVGGKAIMNLTGIDCGNCRTPLRNLSKTELSNLKDELAEIGFFDLVERAHPINI